MDKGRTNAGIWRKGDKRRPLHVSRKLVNSLVWPNSGPNHHGMFCLLMKLFTIISYGITLPSVYVCVCDTIVNAKPD